VEVPAAVDGGIRALTDRIVQFTALQRICSPDGPPPRAATVRRWADGQGIRYKYDRHGGIWTTLDAVNAALGLGPAPPQPEQEEELI